MSKAFLKDPMPGTIINPQERHIACILALDVSSSMDGKPIQELNQGLRDLDTSLRSDSEVLACVDLAIVTFGSKVDPKVYFRPASSFEPPVLKASGVTSMNEAFCVCLDAIEAQKQAYRDAQTAYSRPIFMPMTDGCPTDDAAFGDEAHSRMADAIARHKVSYIPVAIGAYADAEVLKSYYPDKDLQGEPLQKVVLKASKDAFRDIFQWLSTSISSVAKTTAPAGTPVTLPPVPESITISI